MACNGKMIVICTVGLIMVLIPVSLYLVADVAHLFWSSRGQLIKESICSASVMRRYNKRAQGWMDYGIEEFKGASFTAESNGEKLTLQPYTEKEGEYYPIRDRCNLKGDPKGGCLTTDAYYYAVDIPYNGAKSLDVVVRNGENGAVIYNSTYTTSTKSLIDFDSLGCKDVASCTPLCEKLGGTIPEGAKWCEYYSSLEELCYRVNRNPSGEYSIDDPPTWELEVYTGLPGCEWADGGPVDI